MRRVGLLVIWSLRRLLNWGLVVFVLLPWLLLGLGRSCAGLTSSLEGLSQPGEGSAYHVEVVDRSGLGPLVVQELAGLRDVEADLVEPGAPWGDDTVARLELGPDVGLDGFYDLEVRGRGRQLRTEIFSDSVEVAVAQQVMGADRLAGLRRGQLLASRGLWRTSWVDVDARTAVFGGVGLVHVPMVWLLMGFSYAVTTGIWSAPPEGREELLHATRSRAEALLSRVAVDLTVGLMLLTGLLPVVWWATEGAEDPNGLGGSLVALLSFGADPWLVVLGAHAMLGTTCLAILRQGVSFLPASPWLWPLVLILLTLPLVVFGAWLPLALWQPDLLTPSWTVGSLVPLLGLLLAYQRWIAGGALVWLVLSWLATLGFTWGFVSFALRLGHADTVLGAFPRSLADLRRAWRIA